MAKKIDEIELDLRQSSGLEGFQDSVNSLTIQAMRKLLDLGMEPPRVDVVRTPGGVYQVLYAYTQDGGLMGENYGGHHRAVTRLTWRGGLTPLPCNVYDRHKINPEAWGIKKWVNVRDIRRSFAEFDKRFFHVLKHFPREELEPFYTELGVDSERVQRNCLEFTKMTLDELMKGA